MTLSIAEHLVEDQKKQLLLANVEKLNPKMMEKAKSFLGFEKKNIFLKFLLNGIFGI